MDPYVAGDTVQLELTVTRDGLPVNLAGMTIRFALSNGLETIADSETSNDITSTITNAPAGQFEVKLEPELTSTLRGTYRYQAEVTDSSGDIATVANGFITFISDLLV